MGQQLLEIEEVKNVVELLKPDEHHWRKGKRYVKLRRTLREQGSTDT